MKSVQRCVALASLLIEQNFPAIAIHRGMTQEERLSRYQQFKDFQKRILVATNLFGRGNNPDIIFGVIKFIFPPKEWILSVSTLFSTTTCPRTPTHTCTESRGLAGKRLNVEFKVNFNNLIGSEPRVWPSPSSAMRETPRSSTRYRTGSRWTSPSCRTRSTSAATLRDVKRSRHQSQLQ